MKIYYVKFLAYSKTNLNISLLTGLYNLVSWPLLN